MKTCKTCRHWLEGQCRRYPPALLQPSSGEFRFPLTDAEAWCGEHTGKPGRPKRDDSK